MRVVPLARRPHLPVLAIGLAVGVLVLAATACDDDTSRPTSGSLSGSPSGSRPGTDPTDVTGDTTSDEWPALLVRLVADAEQYRWITTGDDLIEVWVCHVPDDTEAGIYAGLPLRLPLTAKEVTDIVRSSVPQYFETISHGLYRPVFRVGGEVTMDAADQPRDCIAEAVEQAGVDAQGLFLVADAEHGSTQPGGFGDVGRECVFDTCAVSVTARAAYIGASDFHPDWGDVKPMDLVQHEIGHLLGWGHNAVDGSTYLSALDVMSNSAAPRDVDPDRRDGPDTIALNRLFAGWLPDGAVWVAPAAGGSIVLAPSTGESGTRLAVVSVSATELLTVELLTADGYNDHLPADGIAVHRVVVDDIDDDSPQVDPAIGEIPFDQLLQPDAEVTVDGWRIAVVRVQGSGTGSRWTVLVTPAG